MSWRKYPDHKSETKAVKQALKAVGYPDAKVGHGTGTAWGWLKIHVEVNRPKNCHCKERRTGFCLPCRNLWDEHRIRILRLASDVTGRDGEYDGNTNVYIDLIPEIERV